eukprot:c12937_g1_i2 orf=534-1112(+)
MLQRNRNLTELKVAGNAIPPNLQAEIDKMLEKNLLGVSQTAIPTICLPPEHSQNNAEGMDMDQDKRKFSLKTELFKLKQDLETLKDEYNSLKMSKATADSELVAVKIELEEQNRLTKHLEEEGKQFRVQAMKVKQDMDELEERLYIDTNAQNAILVEAEELHATTISEYQALQDQILSLREDHSTELRALAD